MTFWSRERIKSSGKKIFTKFSDRNFDANAYKLSLGEYYFVTGYEESPTRKKLNRGEQLCIPTGQFAFLITEEVVTIPKFAMGFISIRTPIKFQGLVNVSGFHVDPGYKGKIVFAVFNAGPSNCILDRDKPLFKIWLADIDPNTRGVYRGKPKYTIESDIVRGMSEKIYSISYLSKKLDKLDKEFKLIRGLYKTSLFAIILTIAVHLTITIQKYIASFF